MNSLYVYTNGLFASKAAAVVGALALVAGFVFVWRLWALRHEVGSFRFSAFGSLALLLLCLGGNRVSVVMFYHGLIDKNSVWPAFLSVGMAISLLILAYLYTRDDCGNKGWGAALALAAVAALFG